MGKDDDMLSDDRDDIEYGDGNGELHNDVDDEEGGVLVEIRVKGMGASRFLRQQNRVMSSHSLLS